MRGIRHFAVAAASGLLITLGVGCASEQPAAVNPNAIMEVEGNKNLSFEAPSNGRITVFDNDTQQVSYSSDILRGNTVLVDMPNNRITLNGQIAVENNLHKGDNYRIYFESKMQMDSSDTAMH